MEAIRTIVVRIILLPLAGLLCSRAALAIAHANNWYPEQQLASLLMASPNVLQVEVVWWCLWALLSVTLWATADRYFYRRAPSDSTRKPRRTPKRRAAAQQASAGIDLKSIGLTPPEGIDLLDEIVVGSMAVSFLNLSNSVGKDTLFKRSHSFFPRGRQIERHMSFHKFYVAIENKSQTKTLRGARILLNFVGGPVGGLISHALLCERTDNETTDIPPGGHDFFVIGEAADGSDAGFSRPRIVDSNEYDRVLAYAEQLDTHHVGFLLCDSKKKQIPLLRNNGYRLAITAYADDTPPVEAVMILNAKAIVEIWLTGEAHTSAR